MQADRHLVWLAWLACALAPAAAHGQGSTDLPLLAALDDPAVARCLLQGTLSTGETCGDADPNCSQASHLVNLLSYLATKTRPPPPAAGAGGAPPAPATCDDGKAPGSQPLEAAFACFDKEFANVAKVPPCLRLSVLDSPYAAVLTPTQRSLAETGIAAALQRGEIDAHCDAATTLCLDRDGTPIGADKLLQKGDRLIVIALSVHASDIGTTSLTVAGIKATDSLAPAPGAPPPKAAPAGAITAYVLAAAITDPIGDDVPTVRINFRRSDSLHGQTIQPRPLDLPVERGRFYVDFGLALPVVVRGKRVVTTPAMVEETTAPRVSFSAIVFPAGRRKGEIRVHGAAAWGIQIGTDFDFTRSVDEKDYYAGVAWEPIAGFGIAAGAALVRGEFIPSTAGPPDLSYMIRPYVGVFLTPDFVSSARAAVSALEAK